MLLCLLLLGMTLVLVPEKVQGHDDNSCSRLGGTLVGEQCLAFHNDLKSWYDAKTACSHYGGSLASFAKDPQAVLAYTKQHYGGEEFWAGGNDIDSEGSWVWLNGEPFGDQFPWRYGEPNNAFGTEDCLLVNYGTAQGFWEGYYDYSCRHEVRYICEFQEGSVLCEARGGVYIGEQCLYFQDNWSDRQNWDTAKSMCEKKGSGWSLASLTIDPEAVYSYAKATFRNVFFYAGGYRILPTTSWKWVNGDAFSASFPWADGENNNAGGHENCLIMYPNGYYDIPCHYRFLYICELDIKRSKSLPSTKQKHPEPPIPPNSTITQVN